MAAATPTGLPARRFPWARASWPSPTCTTRSPRPARTAPRSRMVRRASGSCRKRGARSMSAWSPFSSTRCWMNLLIHRLDAERTTNPSAIGGLLLVAAIAATVGGLGLALDSATSVRRGLGHACASGAAHGGFLAVGWLLAFQGRAGWWGPALRESVALIVASVAARHSPAGAVAYLLVPLVVARDGG